MLSYIPWLIKLLGAIDRVRELLDPPVTDRVIRQVFTYPFSNKFFISVLPDLPMAGFAAALIIMGLGIVSQLRKRDRGALMALIALAVYLLTIVTGIAASWLSVGGTIMVPLLGLFIIALAYGAAGLDRRSWPPLCSL